MKTILLVFVAVLIGSTISVSSAVAGPATDALTSCMADNTTGKDRKEMARWIYVVMSAHPEIKRLSNISKKDRDQVDATLAAIVTRLLTENCQVQAKVAMETETREEPLKIAFGVIGKLAMQELMADAAVNSATTGFVKYLDTNRLKAAFSK